MQDKLIIPKDKTVRIGEPYVKYFNNHRRSIIPNEINLIVIEPKKDDFFSVHLFYGIVNPEDISNLKNYRCDDFIKSVYIESYESKQIADEFGFKDFDEMIYYCRENNRTEYDDERMCLFIGCE